MEAAVPANPAVAHGWPDTILAGLVALGHGHQLLPHVWSH